MKWGMVIDLQKCTGCGECAAACKLENNVAIVAHKESEMGRTMLWMDMLTIYEGEYPRLRVRQIPRPCMACDHPPPLHQRDSLSFDLLPTDERRLPRVAPAQGVHPVVEHRDRVRSDVFRAPS